MKKNGFQILSGGDGDAVAVARAGKIRREILRQFGRFKSDRIIAQMTAAQGGDRIGGDHLSLADDADTIAGAFNFFEDVAGEQDGFAACFFFGDQLDEGVLHQWIEAGGRFVEDEDLRVVHKGGDDAELLLHALAHFF